MPKYKKNIDVLVEKEETIQMMEKSNEQYKTMISLLYLLGARPSEIVILKKDDIEILEKNIHINLQTKKGGFSRTIEYDFDTVFVKDIIIPYIESINTQNIFSFSSPKRVEQIVYDLSGNNLMPYNFRHSRMMKLGMLGASIFELMVFKGAKKEASVIPYVYHGSLISEVNKKKWIDEIPSFLKKRIVYQT